MKKLSGGALLSSGSENSDALVYTYCAGGVYSGNGSVLVTAVNPSKSAITFTVESDGGGVIPSSPRLEWVFTAPGNDMSSTTPVLNGVESAPLRLNEDGSLPPLVGAYVGSGSAVVTLPPLSQSFFVLLSASVSVCV